ncbi:MAG: hypothetical protein GY856_50720 [bacterium]|nr:hypothetical protein [bacterium]
MTRKWLNARGSTGTGSRRRWLGAWALCAGAVSWPLLAGPSGACSVPGTHAKIQAAIDDAACTTITLQTQTYAESVTVARSLTLAGPSGSPATVQGLVLVVGAGTDVQLSDLRVENGCTGGALQVHSGAQVDGSRVEAVRSAALPCPPLASQLFADGFESGDTSAWSSALGKSHLAAPGEPTGDDNSPREVRP